MERTPATGDPDAAQQSDISDHDDALDAWSSQRHRESNDVAQRISRRRSFEPARFGDPVVGRLPIKTDGLAARHSRFRGDHMKLTTLAGATGVAVAICAVCGHAPGPIDSPPETSAHSVTGDNAPVVDYTAEADLPSDAEYLQYRDQPKPWSDPLGEPPDAPNAGASPQALRDYSIKQCERWLSEPPWYRRGAGCHVSETNPAEPSMVIDIPAAEKADLDKKQQEQLGRVCDAGISAGYECRVLDTDGP